MNILKVLTEKRRVGNFGERAAARFLRRHGYKILKRNYVAFDNEIDIIAENREVIAIVEVKTRTAGCQSPKEPRPASSVTPDKQRGIINAAKCYLATRFGQKSKLVRFDVIEVLLTDGRRGRKISEIKHLQNTFNLNTAYRR